MVKRLLLSLFCFALLSGNLSCRRDDAQVNSNSRVPQLQKVKIASGGQLTPFMPLDLAVALGFFKDEGIEPEITYLQGGTATAQALIAGQVDFSTNGIDHALKAAVQGKNDLRMVALLNQVPGMTLVVDSRLRDRVKTIADLKGKPLGVTSKGSATHMILASLLSRGGVDPADVTIVNANAPAFPAALENGQIVGGMALEPFGSILIEQGKAFALADLTTLKETERYLGGPYGLTGLMTRQDVIENNPIAVQKVVNAVVRTLGWIHTHSAEDIANALPAGVVGSDKERYVKTLVKLKEFYSPDGVVNLQGAKNVYESMVASESIASEPPLKVEQFITNDFVDKTKASRPATAQANNEQPVKKN